MRLQEKTNKATVLQKKITIGKWESEKLQQLEKEERNPKRYGRVEKKTNPKLQLFMEHFKTTQDVRCVTHASPPTSQYRVSNNFRNFLVTPNLLETCIVRKTK